MSETDNHAPPALGQLPQTAAHHVAPQPGLVLQATNATASAYPSSDSASHRESHTVAPRGNRGSNAVRVHIRLALGGDVRRIRRGLDISLPTTSTLMEVLPEVLAFIEAPQISLAWEFTTAAGRVLNQHAPIAKLDVADGTILLLGPRRKEPAPVVKDSAEALVDAAQGIRPASNTSTASMLIGLTALAVLLSHPVVTIPLALKATVLAVTSTVLVAWPRGIMATVPGALWAACAATLAVGGVHVFQRPAAETAIALLIGATTAVLYVVAVWVLLATRIRGGTTAPWPSNNGTLSSEDAAGMGPHVARSPLASVATISIFAVGALAVALAAATPAAWLLRPELGQSPTEWLRGLCALLVVAGVVGMQAATTIAGACAGLAVPRLPSAGADLKESDDLPADPDGDARAAIDIHAGIHVGCAVSIVGGLCGLGFFGGWAALILALVTFIALGLHAHRQAHPLCTWSSWLTAAFAVVAMALAAPGPDTRAYAFGIVLSAVMALIVAAAPLWSQAVPRLEPTTIAWLERIESLALFSLLPIALHLTGLFELVRGLG